MNQKEVGKKPERSRKEARKKSERSRKETGKEIGKELGKEGVGVPEEAKGSLKTSKQGLKRSRRITKTRIEKVAANNQNKKQKDGDKQSKQSKGKK